MIPESLQIKMNWAHQTQTNSRPQLTPVCLKLIDHSISLSLVGSGREAERLFLESHYAPFLEPPLTPSGSSIFLHLAKSEYESPTHPIWNDRLPYSKWFEDPRGLILVERDFSALYLPEKKQWHVITPRLGFDQTDIVDNLVNAVLGPTLLDQEALILHAATIERNDRAFLFFGPSGAGKSTLSSSCYKNWGLRVLGSDQIYLQRSSSGLWAHTCPAKNPDIPRQKEAWCTQKKEVKGIFYLKKQPQLQVLKLKREQALPLFLQECISFPSHRDEVSRLLCLCSKILSMPQLLLGQLSYPKGQNFWPTMIEKLKLDNPTTGLSHRPHQGKHDEITH